jgi:type I restriction enzyme S subunit
MFDRSTWKRVLFGDVANNPNVAVTDRNTQGVEKIISLDNIDSDSLHIRRSESFDSNPSFKTYFKAGQTLFGKRRAYLRKVAIAECNGVCTQNILVFESKDSGVLLPELLPFLCRSKRFLEHAIATSKGSLFPNADWKQIKKFEFELPPLDQQRRIAEILWAVDEALGAAIETESAGGVAAAILLKSKMLGSSAGEVGRIRDIGDYRPNDGWKLVKAKDLVCSPITKGATPSPHLNTPAADVPFLKVYNLTFTGDLDFTVNPTFVERAIHERDLKRSRVRAGDILMNLVGPPLGKVSLVPDDLPEANVNQAIAIYRIADPQLRDFFLEYLQSDLAQRWLQSRSKKTSGQQNLTLELAQELPVPIPPSVQLRDAIECSRSFGQLRRAAEANRAAIQQLLSSITNPIFSVS